MVSLAAKMLTSFLLVGCLDFLKNILTFCISLQMFQPFPPPGKQCDKKVRDTELQNSSCSEQEQQHLLETSGSSSSILDNPPGSASISVIGKKDDEKKNPGGFQQQHSPPEGSKLQSGDRHSSVSSGTSNSE